MGVQFNTLKNMNTHQEKEVADLAAKQDKELGEMHDRHSKELADLTSKKAREIADLEGHHAKEYDLFDVEHPARGTDVDNPERRDNPVRA